MGGCGVNIQRLDKTNKKIVSKKLSEMFKNIQRFIGHDGAK